MEEAEREEAKRKYFFTKRKKRNLCALPETNLFGRTLLLLVLLLLLLLLPLLGHAQTDFIVISQIWIDWSRVESRWGIEEAEADFMIIAMLRCLDLNPTRGDGAIDNGNGTRDVHLHSGRERGRGGRWLRGRGGEWRV
jgi:hypothetical protein